MKKFFLSLIAVVLGVFAFYVLYWELIDKNSFSFKTNGISELYFKSIRGDYNIYVDNILLGQVNNKESQIFKSIKSGLRLVRIEKKFIDDTFFYKFERSIFFEVNTRVEIHWEAGPSLESSQGLIKYFRKNNNLDNLKINIATFPDNSQIYVNGELINQNYLFVGQQTKFDINVFNAPYFEPFNFEININEQIRDNLELFVDVFLYKKPIFNIN